MSDFTQNYPFKNQVVSQNVGSGFVIIAPKSGNLSGLWYVDSPANSGQISNKGYIDWKTSTGGAGFNYNVTGGANQSTTTIYATGNLSVFQIGGNTIFSGDLRSISGSLSNSGAALYSNYSTLSGNLQTTGQNLYNQLLSLSGDLQSTGVNLYNLITGISGQNIWYNLGTTSVALFDPTKNLSLTSNQLTGSFNNTTNNGTNLNLFSRTSTNIFGAYTFGMRPSTTGYSINTTAIGIYSWGTIDASGKGALYFGSLGAGGVSVYGEKASSLSNRQLSGESVAVYGKNITWQNNSYGTVGYSVTQTGTQINVGVGGVSDANNKTGINVGGYFEVIGPNSSSFTFPVDNPNFQSSALLVDNRDTNFPIAVFQKNKSEVIQINSGGYLEITATSVIPSGRNNKGVFYVNSGDNHLHYVISGGDYDLLASSSGVILSYVNTVSGNYFTTGNNLQTNISNLTTLFNAESGQLVSYINTVSGNFFTTGGNLQSQINILNNLPLITGFSISGSISQTGLISISGAGSVLVYTTGNTVIISGSASSSSVSLPNNLITGAGITNFIPKFTNSTGLISSSLSDSGNFVYSRTPIVVNYVSVISGGYNIVMGSTMFAYQNFR